MTEQHDEAKRRKSDTISWSWIVKNIQFIIAIVVIIVAFSTLQSNQANLKEVVNRNCMEIEDLKPMKKDIQYIREAIARIEDKQGKYYGR